MKKFRLPDLRLLVTVARGTPRARTRWRMRYTTWEAVVAQYGKGVGPDVTRMPRFLGRWVDFDGSLPAGRIILETLDRSCDDVWDSWGSCRSVTHTLDPRPRNPAFYIRALSRGVRRASLARTPTPH